MKTWLIESINPKFDGKTLGIPFQNGKAVVNAATIDKTIGRTANEIVRLFESDFPVTTSDENGKQHTVQAYKVKLIGGGKEEPEPAAA